jgi:hypothetical protein
MIIQLAAGLYALLIIGIISFQAALVAGAPWGHLTQGGRYQGQLPLRGRMVAGGSITLLLCMGAAIASSAGLVHLSPPWAGSATVVIQTLSAVANWATPSTSERRLWGPISTVMLAAALYVVAMA